MLDQGTESSSFWASGCPLLHVGLELCLQVQGLHHLCSSVLPDEQHLRVAEVEVGVLYPLWLAPRGITLPLQQALHHLQIILLEWTCLSPLRTSETTVLQCQWAFFFFFISNPFGDTWVVSLARYRWKTDFPWLNVATWLSCYLSFPLVAVCGRQDGKQWKRSYSSNVVVMAKEFKRRHGWNMSSPAFWL